MSGVTSEHWTLKEAVKLLIASGSTLQSWMRYFMLVNGALLSALAFLFGWEPKTPTSAFHNLVQVALPMICLLGASLSTLTTGVAIRQIRWAREQRKIVIDLQDKAEVRIFPKDEDIVGQILGTSGD